MRRFLKIKFKIKAEKSDIQNIQIKYRLVYQNEKTRAFIEEEYKSVYMFCYKLRVEKNNT